jgi:hypothetical protein
MPCIPFRTPDSLLHARYFTLHTHSAFRHSAFPPYSAVHTPQSLRIPPLRITPHSALRTHSAFRTPQSALGGGAILTFAPQGPIMNMMAVLRSRDRDRQRWSLALILLYGFVLLASGFAHHDLECHLKSRTHCTSCVFTQSSAGVATATPPPPRPRPQPSLIARDAQPIVGSVPSFFASDSSPPSA